MCFCPVLEIETLQSEACMLDVGQGFRQKEVTR